MYSNLDSEFGVVSTNAHGRPGAKLWRRRLKPSWNPQSASPNPQYPLLVMANEALQVHDTYYMDGRMIILSCGRELFKVPYWHLEKYSPTLLRLVETGADGMQGTSDHTAIPIDGFISKGEFVMFLDFFYRGVLRKEIQADEWCELLVISSKLGCKEVNARAIEELIAKKTEVLPMDRIELGKKYQITQWLPEAYAHLFVREDHLTLKEGERLGLDVTVRVLKGRDACKRNGWTSSEDANVTELVRSIFLSPLYGRKKKKVQALRVTNNQAIWRVLPFVGPAARRLGGCKRVDLMLANATPPLVIQFTHLSSVLAG